MAVGGTGPGRGPAIPLRRSLYLKGFARVGDSTGVAKRNPEIQLLHDAQPGPLPALTLHRLPGAVSSALKTPGYCCPGADTWEWPLSVSAKAHLEGFPRRFDHLVIDPALHGTIYLF